MTDCCNDNCNQGRDCPAKVAPIKCSYSREDEYHTMWAEDLRVVAKCALAMVLITLFGFVGILAFIVN